MPPKKRKISSTPPRPSRLRENTRNEIPPLESPQESNMDYFIVHLHYSLFDQRDFLLHSMNEVYIQNLEFTPEDYDLAKRTLGSRADVVSPNILNKMLEIKHLTSTFPTLEELVYSLLIETRQNRWIEHIYTHCIMEQGFIHSSGTCVKIQEYFERYRVYPNNDQLRIFILQPPIVSVSQEDLDKLERFPNKDLEAVCTICHTDIGLDIQALRLPCNHVFHAFGKNCLPREEGGDSILTWLSAHDNCPMCKAKVVVVS